MHWVSLEAVPRAVRSVPAAHVECAMHDVWFALAVKVPAPQAVHTRSPVAEPAVLT